MEFALGFAAGFFLLPWYWMSMLTLLFIVDIVLVENDCFGWTTTSLLAGLGLAAYFGADVNPFVWAWANVTCFGPVFLAPDDILFFSVRCKVVESPTLKPGPQRLKYCFLRAYPDSLSRLGRGTGTHFRLA